MPPDTTIDSQTGIFHSASAPLVVQIVPILNIVDEALNLPSAGKLKRNDGGCRTYPTVSSAAHSWDMEEKGILTHRQISFR